MARLTFCITLLAALLYATIIDGAAARQVDLGKSVRSLVQQTTEVRDRNERAALTAASANKKNYCGSQPCGWAIYKQFSRQVDTFISNVCICSDASYKCIRTDDDLSVSAYVYHCRQNTTATDIEAPETSDH